MAKLRWKLQLIGININSFRKYDIEPNSSAVFLGQIFIPKNVYLKFFDESHQLRTMLPETDLKRQKNNGKTFLYVFSCFYKFKKDQFRISIKI